MKLVLLLGLPERRARTRLLILRVLAVRVNHVLLSNEQNLKWQGWHTVLIRESLVMKVGMPTGGVGRGLALFGEMNIFRASEVL